MSPQLGISLELTVFVVRDRMPDARDLARDREAVARAVASHRSHNHPAHGRGPNY
jgi:hypothetical protein